MIRASAAVLLAACSGAPARAPPPSAQHHVATEAASVSVEVPEQLRWVSATLGPPRSRIVVSVANRGASAIDVSGLRVHLDAVREGAPFPCDESGPAAREPMVLRPGESYRFDRTLACALPLAGAYSVRVRVAFGRAEWATPRDVQTFTVHVVSTPDAGPRKVEPLPGLWASFGTSSVHFGRDAAAPGRLVVALVNGGATPLELPRFRLALSVYRAGFAIPCEDAPLELDTPAVLGVGAMYRQRVDVSCLGLDVSGRYELAARLQIPGANEVELGRIGVEVTNDPSRRIPAVP
jgi:hypothetical protein